MQRSGVRIPAAIDQSRHAHVVTVLLPNSRV